MKKSLMVVKMRNSAHSTALWRYEITARGLVMRRSLQDERGSGRGMPEVREGARRPVYPGLTDQETAVLEALVELREAPAEIVAQRIGMSEGPALTAALDRLVSLNYVIRLDDAGRTSYRAVAQAVW